MVNLSRSLLLAAIRDLIKVVTPLSVQHIVVEILGHKAPLPGTQDFGLDEGPQELFQGQAVVTEKASHGHGRGGQDAHPARRFLSGHAAQQQVDGYSDPHSEQGAEKLPGGQAEENAFLVLAYFFGNFDFDVANPPF